MRRFVLDLARRSEFAAWLRTRAGALASCSTSGRMLIVLAVMLVVCGHATTSSAAAPESVLALNTDAITDSSSDAQSAGIEFNPLSLLADVGSLSDQLRGEASVGGSYGPPKIGDRAKSGEKGGLSTAINIVVLLTVIGLVPSIMLMTTCFVRIIIVLGLLRQAMGTNSLPPPQVLLGLSLFMTIFVMGPTLERIHKEAIVPYRSGQISDYDTLWERAKAPMKDFMLDQIEHTGNWSSLYMIMQRRGIDISHPENLTRDDVDMPSLIPAFMLSELKTSFLMGFRVYLPFLVIDMVIAALLISMNMMMLPPVLISLPFKLLLFVLVDGWQLVVGSLMDSFVMGGPAVTGVTGGG